jgi:hypothetical protein
MKWVGGGWHELAFAQRRRAAKAKVKTQIEPLLREWGFKRSPKGVSTVFWTEDPDVWWRKRGPYEDLLAFQQHSQKSPETLCSVLFDTTQLERRCYGGAAAPPGRYPCLVVLTRRARRLPWFGEDEMEGGFSLRRPVDVTVDLLRQRLEEMNNYLETGRRTENLLLEETPPQLPRSEFVTAKVHAPDHPNWLRVRSA